MGWFWSERYELIDILMVSSGALTIYLRVFPKTLLFCPRQRIIHRVNIERVNRRDDAIVRAINQIMGIIYLPYHDSKRKVEPVTGQHGDYILVPRTPTESMLKAGWYEAHEENALGVWRDMIDAWESTLKGRELG